MEIPHENGGDRTPGADPDTRHVILHYHIFKNAGTSLDHILKENFGDGWREQEGQGFDWHVEEIEDYLRANPDVTVLSSHTALLPPPKLPNTVVYPIIFIRHPIDRVRSIYEFERRQTGDTRGAHMAKQLDLAGYVNWRLYRGGDRMIRNYHTQRLAHAVGSVQGEKILDEHERAVRAVQSLPFIGLVECFDASLVRLQRWLKPSFPNIRFRREELNVTQKKSLTLDERLAELESELGAELYNTLVRANDVDVELFEAVKTSYAEEGKGLLGLRSLKHSFSLWRVRQ